MTLLMVNGSVASPAYGKQVLQSIVAKLSRSGYSKTVDMVNVQIVLAAAALAGMVIALKRQFTVSVKAVIVFCDLPVFSPKCGAIFDPLVNLGRFVYALTLNAAYLGAGFVLEVITAISTLLDGSNRGSAAFLPERTKVLNVALLTGSLATRLAQFLGGANGGVGNSAGAAFLIGSHKTSQRLLKPLHYTVGGEYV